MSLNDSSHMEFDPSEYFSAVDLSSIVCLPAVPGTNEQQATQFSTQNSSSSAASTATPSDTQETSLSTSSQNQVLKWSNDEIDMLLKLGDDDSIDDWEEIARRLHAAFGTHRSKRSCSKKYSSLDLQRRAKQQQKTQELQKELVLSLGKRARSSANGASFAAAAAERSWTDAQLDMLLNLHESGLNFAEIASALILEFDHHFTEAQCRQNYSVALAARKTKKVVPTDSQQSNSAVEDSQPLETAAVESEPEPDVDEKEAARTQESEQEAESEAEDDDDDEVTATPKKSSSKPKKSETNKKSKKVSYWTNAETERLLELREQGKTFAFISSALSREFGTVRTSVACKFKHVYEFKQQKKLQKRKHEDMSVEGSEESAADADAGAAVEVEEADEATKAKRMRLISPE